VCSSPPKSTARPLACNHLAENQVAGLAGESDHTNRAHSGPELRPCGRRYALRDGDPAVERGCCINYKAPRVFFGPKTAHPHSGIPSPGTEQQRGQQVISDQECMAYLGAVHGTCSSSAYARVLTRCRSHFFPIAVKLNPLNQFGRIGRADEVFAHE
jgi:hypothetical protein